MHLPVMGELRWHHRAAAAVGLTATGGVADSLNMAIFAIYPKPCGS